MSLGNLPGLRSLTDIPSLRTQIYDNVLQATQSIKPVVSKNFSLGLKDVGYEDPAEYSLAEEKRAIVEGTSLGRRLRGTWVLADPAGKVLEEKRATLASVPHLTQDGTFIRNGSKYAISHQSRLRGGIFARQKESGEIESHANHLPGQGFSHHYTLDPPTGTFKVHFGQASFPLWPVLHALGAKNEELRKVFGDELHAANLKRQDPRAITNLYHKIVRKPDPNASLEQQTAAIADSLKAMAFDPDVNQRTLGKTHAKLDKETIVATAKKLLDISRGQADVDDRDHAAFQSVYGPEDLLAERFARSSQLLHQLLWKAGRHGSLKGVPSGVFDQHIAAVMNSSGLGQNLEAINPAEILDLQTRVTRLGEGGISDVSAVPAEARSVQPSQYGYIDPIRTPESFAAGVDSRMTSGTFKGTDRQLYRHFLDARTGKSVVLPPAGLHDKVVALPREMERDSPTITVLHNGRIRGVGKEEVDLVVPEAESTFNILNNLVPCKSAMKGQRASMAARFITQSLPLRNAEAPLVQAAVPGTNGERSYDEEVARHLGAVHAADEPGRVTKISGDEIVVRHNSGEKTYQLYNYYPNNRKTFTHNTPVVSVGDTVTPGQLLARSNFTDASGTAALGLNARTAFMSWKGLNYQDAFVVSDSFAGRSQSEHMYQHRRELDDAIKPDKKSFVGIFPHTFTSEQLSAIDDNGIVKPGTIVRPGDPLLLAASRREPNAQSIHKAQKGSFSDATVTWDHHDEGEVVDAVQTKNGAVVTVKAYSPTVAGDKISNRYGGKGVVAAVLPDNEMPHDEQGRPFEVVFNDQGIISRTNPAATVEGWLGRIAEKRGKPYKIEDFSNIDDLTEWTHKELAKNGMSSMEWVENKNTGRKALVGTGNSFFMKLHHTSESKHHGRGLGAYTAEYVPAKTGGAEGSAKKLSLQDVNALIAHGAFSVLQDAKLIRGQHNPEYWSAYMSGYTPPTPGVPPVYRKFLDTLRASGVNVVQKGTQMHLMALSNKDIEKMTEGREIEHAETVSWKDRMQTIPGGLFDEAATGGHGGNRWAHIKLPEMMPSPVFEEPIRALLGMTEKQYLGVLSGKESFRDLTGPKAIWHALHGINVEKAVTQAREDIAGSRKAVRDAAVKRLGYLKGIQKSGVSPVEWMWDKLPVLPPIWRPVSQMSNDQQLVSDANYLYKEVLDAANNLKDLNGKVDDLSEERLSLYNAMKAVVGLGDPTQPKNQQRRVKGLLGQIFGDTAKYSYVQQKLLGTPVDLIGRAVAIPNPDLTMDEVGLPEERAWEVYSPFIVRRLVRSGLPKTKALEAVDERNKSARSALIQEMDSRPVIVNRAPVLHKYGDMAFYPRLVKGDSLQLSPLIHVPFNLDHDGDTMNYSVPASDNAVREALDKMLPSRNLISTADFKSPVYMPQQEYISGLYLATHKKQQQKEKRPRVFATKQDALRAYWNEQLDPADPIEVLRP